MVDAATPLAAVEPWMGYAGLAAVVVLTVFSLRRAHRKLSTGSSPENFARDQIARLRGQSEMRGDMEQLLVELQELSRQINAQIDTKFAKLEASVRSADERIEKLERLLRAAEGRPTVDTLVSDDPPAQQPAPPGPAAGEDQAARADHQHVHRLADAGHSARDIARETGLPPGEVDLILALRPPASRPKSN